MQRKAIALSFLCIALSACSQAKSQMLVTTNPQGRFAEQVQPNVNHLKAVVFVAQMIDGKANIRDLGLYIDRNGIVLTNAHAVADTKTHEPFPSLVVGQISDTKSHAPLCDAAVSILAIDQKMDLALLKTVAPLDSTCQPLQHFTANDWHSFAFFDLERDSALTQLDSELTFLGIPTLADTGLNVTRGHVVGFVQDKGLLPWLVKTDAPLKGSPGNSGGPVFDTNGAFVGLHTDAFAPQEAVEAGQIVSSNIVSVWIEDLMAGATLKGSDRLVSFATPNVAANIGDVPPSSEGHFFIILGLKQNRADAEEIARKLGGRVVDTNRYLNIPDGFYAAAIGPLSKREHAQEQLNLLLENKDYEAAYVQDAGPFVAQQSSRRDVIIDYYLALESGNGKEALLYLSPTKRTNPNYDADVTSRFYGNMETPLTLTDIKGTQDPSLYEVYYTYQRKGEPATYVKAQVHVEQINGVWYIDSIAVEKGS